MIPPELVDEEGYIDIVGTGGDGQDTFNVSTSSAIVAAAWDCLCVNMVEKRPRLLLVQGTC